MRKPEWTASMTTVAVPATELRTRHRRRVELVASTLALVMLLAACSGADDASKDQPRSATPASTSASTSTSASATQLPATASEPDSEALSLVVLGDSIPYNSPEDCPGCTGFVDLYADAVSAGTGKPVETSNLSEHTGLTLPGLLDELGSFSTDLAEADVIVVGIAHNSFELNADKPCGARFDETTSTITDWSKVNQACASTAAASYRKRYDKLFSTIAELRAGRPTILRTLNRYNDWIGWEDAHLTPAQEHKTVLMHDAWNDMLCRSAKSHGFVCADIYHAFSGASGDKPAGDLLADDYTHPSQAGNDLIAQVLEASGYAPLS